MHWINAHLWLSVMIAAVGIGGLILVKVRISLSQNKTYPSPKRRVLISKQLKNSKEPLLIRLPKLG